MVVTACGTPEYFAPEVFLGVTWQASDVDVWVLKVVLYAFVTGALPFQGSAYYQVYEIVVFGEYFVQSFRVYLPAKDDVCITSMEQVVSGGKEAPDLAGPLNQAVLSHWTPQKQ